MLSICVQSRRSSSSTVNSPPSLRSQVLLLCSWLLVDAVAPRRSSSNASKTTVFRTAMRGCLLDQPRVSKAGSYFKYPQRYSPGSWEDTAEDTPSYLQRPTRYLCVPTIMYLVPGTWYLVSGTQYRSMWYAIRNQRDNEVLS